jgi:hypothetical protein
MSAVALTEPVERAEHVDGATFRSIMASLPPRASRS